MNTPIRRLSVVIAALFGALLVASTIIQFAQAQSLNLMAANKRTLLDNYSRGRGSIHVESQAIAKSVPVDDQFGWLRTYPQAERMRSAARAAAAVDAGEIARSTPQTAQIRARVHEARLLAIRHALRVDTDRNRSGQ